MKAVNMHEAKTHLSKLVEAAARGESFVIAKAGKPMVKVVALTPETSAERPSRRGMLAGVFPAPPENFDTMFQDEIVAMFDGEDAAGREEGKSADQ